MNPVYFQIVALVIPLIPAVAFFIVVRQRDKAKYELTRWQMYCTETRRWLSELPDAADALDNLKELAEEENTGIEVGFKVSRLLNRMRRRRDATVPETSKPADFNSSESKSSSSGGGGGSDGGCSKSIALKIGAGGASCYDGRNSK